QVTQLADAAGKYFTWLILAFGGGAVGYWGWLLGDAATAVNAFTAVMIVACPCNIALSIPFTLGNIQRILGRNRFYLKNIKVVESFNDITAVVLDKTGTITNISQQEMRFKGESLDYTHQIAIRSLVKHSSHPLSRRLYDAMPDIPVFPPENYLEMPGLGIEGTVRGQFVQVGSAAFVGAEHHDESGVFVAVDRQILGHYAVKSRFREGLDQVLAFFRRKPGGKGAAPVFLLSGDRSRDAAALAPYFPADDMMLFHRSPQDKLDFIKKLQKRGQKVLMLGDGLNDAGALRQSDLGIVVAENTNNFTPACDAILHADEFARLPNFIRLARRGVRIVHLSYLVSLTYNAIGLSFAITGSLSPLVAAVLMPISSVSIVLFGVGLSNHAARKLLRNG
ncbi:MAG: HAD-IC family P-type ATPase, partial [Saprospiraceae bacterium]|nr:HAD-IC family P-type ATPase [Saprospiraceae bacterium]